MSKIKCKCAHCGISFARDPSDVRSDRVYCTPKCQHVGITKEHKKPNTRCAACSVPIYVKKCRLAKRNYCKNETCITRRKIVTLSCDVCSTEVKRSYQAVREGGVYCGSACKSRAKRRREQGLPITLVRTTFWLRDSLVKPVRPERSQKIIEPVRLQAVVPADPLNALLTRNWSNEQYTIRQDDGVDEYQNQGTGEHQGA